MRHKVLKQAPSSRFQVILMNHRFCTFTSEISLILVKRVKIRSKNVLHLFFPLNMHVPIAGPFLKYTQGNKRVGIQNSLHIIKIETNFRLYLKYMPI